MSQEDSINALILSANNHLLRAEEFKQSDDLESAVNEINSSVDDLTKAGSMVISEIPKEDVIHLDGSVARILRRLAESSEILPGNFSNIIIALPNSAELLGEKVHEISDRFLSAENIVNTVKDVYERETQESSDTETDFSTLKIIKDMLSGNQKLSEGIFSENGIYDIFVNAAVPYITMGASLISRDEAKNIEEENVIPDILNGPVKHLSKLLLSLMTSAFMSGLLLLVVKRILGGKGIANNINFGMSLASLTLSNLPMLIEGVKAVSVEITNLKNIVYNK